MRKYPIFKPEITKLSKSNSDLIIDQEEEQSPYESKSVTTLFKNTSKEDISSNLCANLSYEL